jgi:hypothetical protein
MDWCDPAHCCSLKFKNSENRTREAALLMAKAGFTLVPEADASPLFSVGEGTGRYKGGNGLLRYRDSSTGKFIALVAWNLARYARDISPLDVQI